MTDEETEPFLTIEGTPVYFAEDWSTGIGGGLWSTGSAMAKYFIDHANLVRHCIKKIKYEDNHQEIKALELGSGNGLLSVCLAAVVRDANLIHELVVTDLDDHLELMNKTLNANRHIIRVDKSHDGNKPFSIVREHRWGEFDNEKREKFDFIFGSDVAYRDWLHAPLIESLNFYSHEESVILIGVTMHDTKPKFFQSLKENGYTYLRIPDWQMAPEFRGTTFGLFLIQKVKQ